jgi:hypothetical protein
VLEQVFNQRHVALIDELYPDCVFRSPSIGEERRGLQTIHEVGNRSLPRWPVDGGGSGGRRRAPRVSAEVRRLRERGIEPFQTPDST